MKRFALLLASVAFVTPALAADVIYEEPPAPAPMVEAAPMYNWSGFYVGGQAGVAFNRDSGAFSSENSAFNGGNDGGETGFIGGGHVGYDYQMGNFVLGAVADLNYIDANADSSFSIANNPLQGGDSRFGVETDINYVGTVRAKAGYAMDRFMVYATGGLAYADIDSKVRGGNAFNGANDSYAVSARSKTDDVGYAVGAGFDVLATQNVSFGLEYLYTDLGKAKTTVDFDAINDPANSFSATSKSDLDYHSVMAKASYHFN
ncbi:MAG: porin family protein [Brevundimonas sp.]|jgi:outer membrane immunogenic protein|nr:MAG: porin family protein [Brevundimonas sp.]